MADKCKIKMKDKRLPVDGSVVGAEGKETGTCPECLTPGVMLSVVGGYVRAHVIADRPTPENNPQAPTLVDPDVRRDKSTGRVLKVGKGLAEPVTLLTDTGVRVGDPRAAEQRRTAQIEGAAGIGTVQVPRRVKGNGTLKSGAPRMTTKMVDVPATEEHTREALDYWRNRRVTDRTSDAMRKKQGDMIASLSRRLEAIMGAQVVQYNDATRSLDVVGMAPVAEQPELFAQVDRAAAQRGPTLIRGRRMEATEVTGPRERAEGAKPVRTTCEGPLGRERADRMITTVPEPKPKRTAAQRARYRRQQRLAQLIKDQQRAASK